LDNDFKTAVSRLKQGQAPGNMEILSEISVGIQPFIRFIEEKYLLEYIAQGGSKIKFVTGRLGSGKTHFIEFLSFVAEARGFITVNFSARDIWLHDFKDIYFEILNRSDFTGVLKKCANHVIRELGYDALDIPQGMTFADYLSAQGELNALTKKEIRNQLQQMFLNNPLIDNNFAIACSLLTGGILGHPALENANRELLLLWLAGSKEAKLPSVRKLGLSPARITKFNARHMLRSLAEVQKLAGFPGMLITIDDVEILAGSGAMDTIRYTKLKREDAYESIRELIDEIDTLKNILFVFAFDRKLIDDDMSGLKSYNALWLRIQNEIVSEKFNQFTDIVDLDVLGKLIYSKEAIIEMSGRFAEVINRISHEAAPIGPGLADEMLQNDSFASVSLPRQVGLATVNAAAGAAVSGK
jgi:hypothetical protein